MKNVVLGLLFVLFASSGMAQSGKIGFVDVQSVIAAMPEFKSAQQQLSTFAESLISPEMKTKGELIEQKYKAYEAEEATMGDARKEVAQKEIMKLERELQNLHQVAQTQQKLAQKQTELFGPIETKAGQMIEAVAKENGFTVVFDASSSPLVYADQGANMMPLIKAKLGQ